MELVIPGGREKGTPIGEASDSTLQYWAEKANDQAIRDHCAAELERRGMLGDEGDPPEPSPRAQERPAQQAPRNGGGQRQAARPSNALAVRTLDVSTAADLVKKLDELNQSCIVVAPSTAMADIPEGFSPALSIVKVDPNGGPQEVYKVGDGLGLARATLDKLLGAMGGSVVPQLSRRLDDGSHPHYCEMEVFVQVRQLDGTTRMVRGHKQLDLRDGSPQYEALRIRAEKKFEREKTAGRSPRMGDWESQVRDMRLFIAEHCESKARLRAIRSLGFKSNYTAQELAKPFAVVSLAATGRSEDPELRRQFATLNYAAAVSGANRLYGGDAPAQRRAPITVPGHEVRRAAPPPVGAVEPEFDDDGEIY